MSLEFYEDGKSEGGLLEEFKVTLFLLFLSFGFPFIIYIIIILIPLALLNLAKII